MGKRGILERGDVLIIDFLTKRKGRAKAAFDRRDEFAQEVLAAVLAVNASGITLDYEGTCDGTSATLAQFAAT